MTPQVRPAYRTAEGLSSVTHLLAGHRQEPDHPSWPCVTRPLPPADHQDRLVLADRRVAHARADLEAGRLSVAGRHRMRVVDRPVGAVSDGSARGQGWGVGVTRRDEERHVSRI
jgi:hypothetical protein